MSAAKNDHGQAGEPGRGANGADRADSAGAGSIDKVRDILFGNQVREFDRRFARLEERMLKESSDLKDHVKARLDALEQYTKKETESLGDQLKAEHEDRVEAHAGVSRELKETAKSLERRTSSLDDQLAKSQRELRQQMLDQHQRLSDDLRKRTDDILAALARETQELRGDKVDRSALAAMLTELAMRLTNEVDPSDEDAENG